MSNGTAWGGGGRGGLGGWLARTPRRGARGSLFYNWRFNVAFSVVARRRRRLAAPHCECTPAHGPLLITGTPCWYETWVVLPWIMAHCCSVRSSLRKARNFPRILLLRFAFHFSSVRALRKYRSLSSQRIVKWVIFAVWIDVTKFAYPQFWICYWRQHTSLLRNLPSRFVKLYLVQ